MKAKPRDETRRDETLTLDVRDAVTPQHCKTQSTNNKQQLNGNSTCRKVLTNAPNSVEGHRVHLRIKIDLVKTEIGFPWESQSVICNLTCARQTNQVSMRSAPTQQMEGVSYTLFIASHNVCLHVAIPLVSTRFTRESQSVTLQ